MNEYARIYSEFGIREMIENAEMEIKLKEKDKLDQGKSWTEEHINAYVKTIDEEIEAIQNHIKELLEALDMKTK